MNAVTSLVDEMNSIRWFHRIELSDGIVTPGVDNSQRRLETFHWPDLSGKTVLDIGAWDGFFSFEAERRGASRVLATDAYIWEGKGWASKRGFDLAKRTLNSRVEEMVIDPMELCPERVGTWDVVFYYGILYHMRHPLLALEHIASVTKDLLIMDTHLDLMFARRPAAAFYEGTEAADDPTNWWGPNDAAVHSMLRTVGFNNIRRVYNRNFLLRAARSAKWVFHGQDLGSKNPLVTIQQGRAVYHASRDGNIR
jgi:tRNA (mo5U34)-methyltransferase